MSYRFCGLGLSSQPPHCEGSGIILPKPAATQGVAGREGMLRQNLFIAQLPTGATVRHPYWPWLGYDRPGCSVEGTADLTVVSLNHIPTRYHDITRV